MSGQHTPGPWTCARNPENTRWIIDSEPARAIACTAGYEPDNEANARLIAAAPQLLEALVELDRVYETGDFETEFRPALAAARAAIAAATGGAA